VQAPGSVEEAPVGVISDSRIRELARKPDPTHSATQSVDAIQDFHELRERRHFGRNKHSHILLSSQDLLGPDCPWGN
jgi:hypothetical protein